MKARIGHALLALTLIGGASCGGGPNATFYKVAVEPLSEPSGTNCPANGSLIETYTGLSGEGVITIYEMPDGSNMLDLGAVGLAGTEAGGKYSFSGNELDDQKSAGSGPEIKKTAAVSVALASSGQGLTGTVTLEDICTSSGTTGCAAVIDGQAGQDGPSYDCTQSAQVIATKLVDPQQVEQIGTGVPSTIGFRF